MRDCGVARWFLWVEISPWFPVSCLIPACHGKSPTVSSTRPKQKPVSRVSASHQSKPWCFLWAWWLLDGHLLPSKWACEPMGQVHYIETEMGGGRWAGRELLCSPGIILAWVWVGPGASSKGANFPSFSELSIGPSSSYTGRPFWSITSAYAMLPSTVHVPAPSVPTRQSGTREGSEEC